MTLKLNIIIGSTRPGRGGPVVAKWVEDIARADGRFEVELVDLADFRLPVFDEPAHPRLQKYEHEHTKRWAKSVESADAFLFVAPEYDYFPNAALVNALQYLSVEWAHKVAGIVSYGGASGGLRAAQELRLLISNLNMMPIPQTVPLAFYNKNISDEQIFTATEPMVEGLKGALAELEKWAKALKTIR